MLPLGCTFYRLQTTDYRNSRCEMCLNYNHAWLGHQKTWLLYIGGLPGAPPGL